MNGRVYARGLQAMKALLPSDALADFSILEARMIENIHREKYGYASSLSFEIIDLLNRLAEQYKISNFTEIAMRSQSAQSPVENRGNNTKDSVPPEVTVELFSSIIPMAYYHLLDSNKFPLLLVTIDNTNSHTEDASLLINAFIEGYSDQARKNVTVPKGKCEDFTLSPVLNRTARATFHHMDKASLQYSVTQIFPNTRNLIDDTMVIQLLAKNYMLLGIRKEDKEVRDLTNYLAAWVTPDHPEVNKVLRQAAQYHPEKSLNGYEKRAGTEEEQVIRVREQVHAIYQALKCDVGLTYTHSELNWKVRYDYITQKVRLPGECLAEGSLVNCLDGAILFASLLARIGIAPLLVLIPGHALVGWRIAPSHEAYELIDTTIICDGTFEQARLQAHDLYASAQTKGYFERPLYHEEGFARRIDILEQRNAGINSLE